MPDPNERSDLEVGGALPADPVRVVDAWLQEAFAHQAQGHAHAVTLATVDPDGRPSARIVLCKEIDVETGSLVFYTNFRSRKGRALDANPHAAVVFHWDRVGRQARVDGPVTLVSDLEADEYFDSRPLRARLAAVASNQSDPLDARESLLRRFDEVTAEAGVDPDAAEGVVARPKHWGGYRVWADRVELWVSAPDRLHDRALYTRELAPKNSGFVGGPWTATRLQP